MDNERQTVAMGKADLQIGGWQLWIHARQFPNSEDYWDGNWLMVTVRCYASGAEVWVKGPILHLSELHHWKVECESMYASLLGEANLECIEQNVAIKLKMTQLGQVDMWVSITPDHLDQQHCFKFEIDQSYLAGLIKDLKTIFRFYPIRGLALE